MGHIEKGEIEMKRKLCMAMAAMMVAGATPAFGAESTFAAEWVKYDKKETKHLFTAKTETTEFKKDGIAQLLDVPIYIKNGYVMLPLRTFMTAVDADATMTWDNMAKRAQVELEDTCFSFDVNGNRIWRGGKLLDVSGKMEVRDGRVFVPLRNWGNILNELGYVVGDGDIIWDGKTKTATIRAMDVKLVDRADPLVLRGKGKEAEYSFYWPGKYDDIQSIGDGYFIAKKYVNTAGDIQGRPVEQNLWQSRSFLLDGEGRVLLKTDGADVISLVDHGEGYLRVDRLDEPDIVIDREGNVQFEVKQSILGRFSEGMAMALHDNAEMEDADAGYINTKGELVIPLQFYDGNDFSEGLAAAAVHYPAISRPQTLYGYINKDGEWVIEPQYFKAGEFTNGIAKVTLNGRVGYIDKEGNEIVNPRYDWGSDFHEGKAFVKEKDGRVFLIDTTGKQLNQITDGLQISHFADGILKQKVSESIAPGNVKYVDLYFDENGQISEKEARLKANLSEGLAAMQDDETGKYGYVDETGRWIIAPAFDRAEPFEDGYAIVANEITLADGTEDIEWGIIKHPEF